MITAGSWSPLTSKGGGGVDERYQPGKLMWGEGLPGRERYGIGVPYGADQHQAELSDEAAAGSPAAEEETWGHLWADWHPVFRGDQEEFETIPGSAVFGEDRPVALAAQHGEDQSPQAGLRVTTTFPAEALAELPDARRSSHWSAFRQRSRPGRSSG